jgi:hypothetical protein
VAGRIGANEIVVLATAPLSDAEMVAVPEAEPTATEAAIVAELAPAGTVTFPATVTAAWLELNATAYPPEGAAPERVMVHVLVPDTLKLAGLQAIPLIATGGGAEVVTANTGSALPPASAPSVDATDTTAAVPGTVSVATTPSGIDPVLTPYAMHE